MGPGPIPEVPDPSVLSDGAVYLRAWRPADAAALAAAWQDPEITGRLPVPRPRDEAAAGRWIDGWETRCDAGLALDLVICEWPGDGVRGEVGLSSIDAERRAAKIGWWLAEGHRGRGLAARAVDVVVRWVLESGWLDLLVAEIDPDNTRSTILASRCGFADSGRVFDGRQVWVARVDDREIHRRV